MACGQLGALELGAELELGAGGELLELALEELDQVAELELLAVFAASLRRSSRCLASAQPTPF